MCGSTLLMSEFGELTLEILTAAGECELPADFRRKSIDDSSQVNDARECFGCKDNRAPKFVEP